MKRTILQLTKFTYFFTCFWVILSINAQAYIDPSTVTYVIQGVAGILVAVGAAFTIFRHKIKAAWRKWYYNKVAQKNMQHQINAAKEKESQRND